MNKPTEIEICGKPINTMMLMGLAYSEGEARRLLNRMLAAAALTTHPKGNRRYGAFVLKVVCNQLQSVFLDSPKNDWCRDCLDTGVAKVYDEEQGIIYIPCQSCNKGVEHERQDAVSVGNVKKSDSRRAV